jgi:hypothetical protein
MNISACQQYPQRGTKGIDNSMDLCGQAAPVAAYFLFEVPPFALDPFW